MKYDKNTYDYLLKIIIESKTDGDIASRIMEELVENNSCPETLFSLCQNAIKRAEKGGYLQLERTIKYVLGIFKKLSDGEKKDIGQKIKELLLADYIISKCYYTLTEALKYIDDLSTGKQVLIRKFELLKDKAQKNSYQRVMIVENNKNEVIDREEFRIPDIHDFTKLAMVYEDICGKEDKFSREVVNFAVSSIKCEWFLEVSELGEWYTHIGDYAKALECYHRAEELVKENFDFLWILTFNLWAMGKNGNRDYAMEIMLKAIRFVRESNVDCSERYIRLAEVCSSGDRTLTLELLRTAQRTCDNYEQLKNVQQTTELIREQWAQDEIERNNDNADK